MTTPALDKDTLWTIDHKINDGDEVMVVISSCPHCGAPLYAPNTWVGPTPPPVVHTCECRYLSATRPSTIVEQDGTGQTPPVPVSNISNDARNAKLEYPRFPENAKQPTSDSGPTFRVGPWLMHTKWVDPLPM